MTGRPSKYSDEILAKVKDYIKNYKKFDDLIPSIAGLSCAIGIAKSTIYEWQKEAGKEIFSDMLEELLSKQERILLSGGLSGDLNSTITKLVLAKHNYSEKIDSNIDHTTKGDKINMIERVIVRPEND